MANFYDNSIVQKVTGTVHIDNYGSVVPVSGTVAVSLTPAKIPVTNVVAATTSSVLLISANTARKQVWVYNTGPSFLYLGLGAVTTNSYFLKMEPEGYWELPVNTSIYTGAIYGVFSTVVGSATTTEIR